MSFDTVDIPKVDTPKIEKPSKGFFDMLGDFFSSLKEKFTTAVDSIKNLFGLELNVLKTDVQKNENKQVDSKEYNLEYMPEDEFNSLILYLSHQQGEGGIKQILHYIETGEKPQSKIYYNMANNVEIAYYNKLFGTNCKSVSDMQQVITPKNFLFYWQKLYHKKQQTSINNTKYDNYIIPLSKKYNVNPDTVRTFIGIESDFVPTAGKGKKYVGLMQISPELAKTFGFSLEDRLDPAKNIEMGIRYIVDNRKSISSLPMQKTYAMLMQSKNNLSSGTYTA